MQSSGSGRGDFLITRWYNFSLECLFQQNVKFIALKSNDMQLIEQMKSGVLIVRKLDFNLNAIDTKSADLRTLNIKILISK